MQARIADWRYVLLHTSTRRSFAFRGVQHYLQRTFSSQRDKRFRIIYRDKCETYCTFGEAKDARNYSAYEGAMFFASSNNWLIVARLKSLRQEVAHLAHGANLVFLRSYEIENKEPGPLGFFEAYPQMVDHWVFGHVIEFIETFGDHPEVKRSEEGLLEYERATRPKARQSR
jgi:hypothetical protein